MKIKNKMFVDLPKYSGDIDKPETWHLWMLEESCDCCLGEVEVEFEIEIPSKTALRDAKIVSLKSEIDRERADSQVKVERLKDKIQQLMALELVK